MQELTTDRLTETVSECTATSGTHISYASPVLKKENGKLIKARGQGRLEESSVFWT